MLYPNLKHCKGPNSSDTVALKQSDGVEFKLGFGFIFRHQFSLQTQNTLPIPSNNSVAEDQGPESCLLVKLWGIA